MRGIVVSSLLSSSSSSSLTTKIVTILEIKPCVMIILSYIQHVKKDRKCIKQQQQNHSHLSHRFQSVLVVFIALDGISIEDELWAIYFFNIVHHHPDTLSLSLSYSLS